MKTIHLRKDNMQLLTYCGRAVESLPYRGGPPPVVMRYQGANCTACKASHTLRNGK